ncbi:hypothetical protein AB0J83_43305 [Actinoplanes sp. NPDC049596]|uniref:hypothetical protein n=1 Tax=unclassified Actinoplanes TaxID=2626549 RepID=UPI00343434F7
MTTVWVKRGLIAGSVVVALLAALWGLWFLALLVFGSEESLPPKSRIPDVPAGATVADQRQACGSGGCSWLLTVTPPPGQSPEDLAREMGVDHEQTLSPRPLDPAFVAVGSEVRDGRLAIYVNYR